MICVLFGDAEMVSYASFLFTKQQLASGESWFFIEYPCPGWRFSK